MEEQDYLRYDKSGETQSSLVAVVVVTDGKEKEGDEASLGCSK